MEFDKNFKGFVYGAYIFKNNERLRNRLEELGYVKDNKWCHDGGDCLMTYSVYLPYCTEEGLFPHYIECTKEYFEGVKNWCSDRIKCGTDEEKFLRVVSMVYSENELHQDGVHHYKVILGADEASFDIWADSEDTIRKVMQPSLLSIVTDIVLAD